MLAYLRASSGECDHKWPENTEVEYEWITPHYKKVSERDNDKHEDD